MYCVCVGCACVGGIELLITSNGYFFIQFMGYSHGFVKRVDRKVSIFHFSLFGLSKEEHEKRDYFGVVVFLFRKKILVSFVRSWLFTLVPHSKPNAGPFAPQHT